MASGGLDFSSFGHPLFRRCVQCPPESPPCPPCAEDETCSLNSPSCDACATTTCVKIGTLPGQAAPEKSTPVGGIIGGVVGGVAVLVIATYLIWRFCIRKKKRVDTWDPPEKRDQSTLARNRQSTRSTHSIASTVLTRASNVIQIAYIPGITVRSPPDSPSLLVPPVPSIPGGSNGNSAYSTPHLEQHFFMPGDLRDSTWSDTSSIDPRISIAPSLARQSVATTIYHSDEVVPPVPAQHAFAGKANVVSVRSGTATPAASSSTPASRTPQSIQAPKFGNGSSIVARNVMAKPVEIRKVNSGARVPTLGNLAKEAASKEVSRKSSIPESTSSPSEKSTPVFYDEKEVVVGTPSTVIDDSPISPLAMPRPAFAAGHSARSSSVSAMTSAGGDAPASVTTHRKTNSNSALNAMIEDAINRARDPQHVGVSTPRPELKSRDSGPFSDMNEVKENFP